MPANLTEELTKVEARIVLVEARLDSMLSCDRPTYTVDGVAYTADQLKAAGWNDAQIAAVPQS